MKKFFLSLTVLCALIAGGLIYNSVTAVPAAWADVGSLDSQKDNARADLIQMYDASSARWTGINWNQLVYEVHASTNWQSLGYTNNTINWQTLYIGN